VNGGAIYFESWFQFYIYAPFDDTATDYMHTRDFLLYNISDQVGLGVELDINLALSNKPLNADGDETALLFFPIGPHLKLFYGEGSTLELFVGYDIAADDFDKNKLAGRFTFVQTF